MVQYYFGVNCNGYLFMLQNIFSHIKKFFILKLEQKLLKLEEITEVSARLNGQWRFTNVVVNFHWSIE